MNTWLVFLKGRATPVRVQAEMHKQITDGDLPLWVFITEGQRVATYPIKEVQGVQLDQDIPLPIHVLVSERESNGSGS